MIVALMALAQAAAGPDCAHAMTQLDMNMCAAAEFEHADAELNRLWGKLIADARADDRSPDSGRTAADQRSEETILRTGQRAWVQFRDSQCEFEGLSERGGSMEPMIVSQCKARVTEERIKQLSSDEE